MGFLLGSVASTWYDTQFARFSLGDLDAILADKNCKGFSLGVIAFTLATPFDIIDCRGCFP